ANNSPLEDVCGIAYYDKSLDKVVINKRSTLVNLNDYPPFPYWRGRFNPIEIMRGCPWACKYCQVSFMFKAKPRYRDVDVVEYYSRIMLREGLRDLRFIAPDSFAYMSADGRKPNPSAIEELLERLHKLVQRYKGRIFYGTFPSEVRPNSVDYELARIVRKYVANKSIIIGAQTGSDRLLKLINRGHTVDNIIHAAEALIKAGFRVDVDFIFGLPGETREDIEDTLKVIEKLVRIGARIHAHTFMPLPGTPFADAPPGRLEPWLRKRLYLLLGRGFLYGDWLKQEREAEMIDWYRRAGIIFTGKSLSMNTRIRYCGKQ
ncbi:MAG TPA: TIGR04013 family B12-binding domain/radical SAM domain-containing protein, partial [Desulfurococcaceae archaeon]|nr:TIGR04013 family B12-binding domain/radical SAM domain-containing protein [Desulfurococcaceae archaeon]